MLTDRNHIACVYGEFESNVAPARLKLSVQTAKQSHHGVVRAVVTLE